MEVAHVYISTANPPIGCGAEQELWQSLLDRLAPQGLAVQVHRCPPAWAHTSYTPEEILEALTPNECTVNEPAVILVPVSLQPSGSAIHRAYSTRIEVVQGFAGGRLLGDDQMWPLAVRALFIAAYRIENCPADYCFCHRPSSEPTEFGHLPQAICPSCLRLMGGVRSRKAKRALEVHDWLSRNAGPGITPASLARIAARPRRFWQVSAARPTGRLRITTEVLIAYAEEPSSPGGPAKQLGDEPWGAGTSEACEAWRGWSSLPDALRSALEELPGPDQGRKMRDLDALSYLSTKRHREHADHIMNTGLLGQLLLDALLPGGHSVRDAVAQVLASYQGASADEVRSALWLASVWHDVGYTLNRYLEVVTRTAKSTAKPGTSIHLTHRRLLSLASCLFQGSLVDPEWLGRLTNNRNKLLSRVRDEALSVLHDTFAPSSRSARVRKVIAAIRKSPWAVLNHGIWSLVLFHHALEGAGRSVREGASSYLWVLACEAILLHDMSARQFAPKKSPVVRFQDNPLLVILKLCDTAQEWDRHLLAKEEMVAELKSVDLLGLEWGLSKPARLGRELSLLLEYRDGRDIVAAEWEYALAVRGMAKRLAELRFPRDGFWRGGPKEVSFQITSPSFSPGLVERMKDYDLL